MLAPYHAGAFTFILTGYLKQKRERSNQIHDDILSVSNSAYYQEKPMRIALSAMIVIDPNYNFLNKGWQPYL